MRWYAIPVLSLLLAAGAAAEEQVRTLRLTDLEIDQGALPGPEAGWSVRLAEGEVLVEGRGAERVLLVRVPGPGALHGVLAVEEAAAPLPFTVPAERLAAAPVERERYLAARRSWCEERLERGARRGQVLPDLGDRGERAWWLLQHARAGGPDGARDERPERRGRELDATLDLFSGVVALRENLQFERTLRLNGDEPESVPLAELPTLAVREVPWERLPGGSGPVALDALAACIPGDQHALLVPSFAALADGLERIDGLLAGPLQALGGQGDAGSAARYQRQLGLELTELSRRFGAQVVEQVAVTGSDPFLRTGTDCAVLLRARRPELLAAYLGVRLDALVKAGAAPLAGRSGALAWRGAQSADRTVSALVLVDGAVVVVANSAVQLDRYAAVRAGSEPALAAAPEYAFFRRRYPLAGAGELALAVVPDAALRRWCSARWRIGDARRMRAAAVLATLQAEWVAAGARADWRPQTEPAGLGAITIGPDGVRSQVYGSLAFLTPVAELAFERATTGEAEAFRRFHQRYQSSWRDYLDPIALHLATRADGGLAVDLSVIPLIMGSEYRELIALAGGASLQAGAGDPHRSAFQLAIALDPSSGPLAEAGRHGGAMLGGLDAPFSWLGSTASLYADEDPFWDELAQVPDQGRRWAFLRDNLRRLPVGASLAVADPLKLAAFLTGVRAMVAQSAPGLVQWNARSHREVAYVEVAPAAGQGRGMGEMANARLYYLPAPEGLTITTSEAVMQRAIERLLAARAPGAPAPADWPGRQCALVAAPGALRVAAAIAGEEDPQAWMQRRSWGAIAILNEWHRLFPGQDPVAVHERLWGMRLTCPGGGSYRWDERWLTMESSAYGHPDQPRPGPPVPAGIAALDRLALGLSFEELPAAAATGAVAAPAPGRRRPAGGSYGLRVSATVTPQPATR